MISGIFRLLHPPIVLTTPSPLKIPGNTKEPMEGNAAHEGIDIMASVNQRGIYPIVSMTDGTIQNLGWLELGGYRIGILAPGGAYFYYAHLDSYAPLTEGSRFMPEISLGIWAIPDTVKLKEQPAGSGPLTPRDLPDR